MLTVNHQIQIPLEEFRFSYARSSGPGGQNVNKVNTKVTLHWDVTKSPTLPDDVRNRFCDRYRRRITKEGELVIQSQRFRDQSRNVSDCLDKLRELILAVAQPQQTRKPTRRSYGSIQRRLQDKRKTAEKKQGRRSPRADD